MRDSRMMAVCVLFDRLGYEVRGRWRRGWLGQLIASAFVQFRPTLIQSRGHSNVASAQ